VRTLASPNAGKEIERDEGALPNLGCRNDCFDLIRVIRHHFGVFRFFRDFKILVFCLPRILKGDLITLDG
jgi:hypothetical protein